MASILLGPPANLSAIPIDRDSVQLSWIPSTRNQVTSSFSYVVNIGNGNGTLVYKKMVTETQLIINTVDSCYRYEVTVVPVCQGTAEVTTVRTMIPGGKNGIYLHVRLMFMVCKLEILNVYWSSSPNKSGADLEFQSEGRGGTCLPPARGYMWECCKLPPSGFGAQPQPLSNFRTFKSQNI